MRTRRCLGMVLHSKHRQLPMTKPFYGPIVQVDVSHFQLTRACDRTLTSGHRKPMVLRCDEHFAGFELLNGMIPAAVAIRHFDRRSAEGQSKKLVAEADPKRWNPSAGDVANNPRRITDCLRVARTVGEKHAVRL